MNLETNTISFDLVSELFIDKFDEKIKKLKDDDVSDFSNIDVKAIKEKDKIYIFVIKSNDNDYEDGYEDYEENDEGIDKYFNDCDTYYAININNFKINISAVKTFKTNTDFESILHSENIMASLVNETLQEIKKEISKIKITKDDIENYMKKINGKPIYSKLPDCLKPIEIYIDTKNNCDKVFIELTYKPFNKISAIYDNGEFKSIGISIEHCLYKNINREIQTVSKALKAFQYYLYNTYTGNELYKKKYTNLLYEL
jgi:hypothetical protein